MPTSSPQHSRGCSDRACAAMVSSAACEIPIPCRAAVGPATSGSRHLDDHRDAHAAANAQRGHARCRRRARAARRSSVVRMRAPLAPIGWPSAIAPPRVFTLLASSPSSRATASDCDGERFVQLEEIDVRGTPGWRARAPCASASTGPMPMIAGSTPVEANDRILRQRLLAQLRAPAARSRRSRPRRRR